MHSFFKVVLTFEPLYLMHQYLYIKVAKNLSAFVSLLPIEVVVLFGIARFNLAIKYDKIHVRK